MAKRHIVYRRAEPPSGPGAALLQRFEAIRDEFEVPEEFPADVLAEARGAAAAAQLPTRDLTDIPFITIDPAGSQDLDQAMHIERQGDGYRVRYAIADVPAFVTPGGPIDEESRRRGQTIYCPDKRVQLHPPEVSEGAASLLPDQVRPAFVWDLVLAADGEGIEVTVERALVRSVRRYDYAEVQRLVDDGSAEAVLKLLKEVGEKRIALERKRGGASLPLPDQEVADDGKGGFTVSFRPLLASEDWNAQISLLTGMGAADLMLRGKVGILRTMPDPDPRDVKRFRRQAAGAGVPWSQEMSYGEFLRTLDRDNPKHLALVHEATALFRGAGYTPFQGAVPDQPAHSAVANPYAHVTAPLRRLVDRFGLVVCEALSAGTEVPAWALSALPTIPEIMTASDRRASGVERACTDAVEAAELRSYVGSSLEGVVVDQNEKHVIVQLIDLAVVARATGRAEEGQTVQVHVDAADIESGRIKLSIES
ncbi:RNB domain-containing ribonuclease [Intrasporangium calvum]|uniref:Ribonuclease II n=1 Tax=Intrasporangium calvum (strain ATCC 23552 / DSM 43043 / JCM 3097 / NBRC 12989 / NCIMB 10167 / NRRL B-3866 / 7 KIP) TaxID=710696 RepID=E6SCH7_INTC7|nr:RNB domain-containing ribonuclease [Intrasporangium calvum]ADU48556.1 ribonuclease II [Intrasporangium calvum DSM 43043]AXG13568.1 RNB domain-containing ribonuclease [Intrasporangium calvum]